MNFSVIMSVYKNDDPIHLDEALRSILVTQSMVPSQVVIVVDGNIPTELEDQLSKSSYFFKQIDILRLPTNIGLSNAMNNALDICRHELVFRMDADDISIRNRFELQIKMFEDSEDISMVGGFYQQFDFSMKRFIGERKVPVNNLMKYAYRRTPINHVTIGFKRSAALAVGGYPDTRLPFEDWWFALRFLRANKIIVNIPCCLVKVRGGSSFYGRRSGLVYLRQEVSAMKLMYSEKLIPFYYAFTNIIIRAPLRLAPSYLIELIYKKLLR